MQRRRGGLGDAGSPPAGTAGVRGTAAGRGPPTRAACVCVCVRGRWRGRGRGWAPQPRRRCGAGRGFPRSEKRRAVVPPRFPFHCLLQKGFGGFVFVLGCWGFFPLPVWFLLRRSVEIFFSRIKRRTSRPVLGLWKQVGQTWNRDQLKGRRNYHFIICSTLYCLVMPIVLSVFNDKLQELSYFEAYQNLLLVKETSRIFVPENCRETKLVSCSPS